MLNAQMLTCLVPISQFNKGQAAKVIDRVQKERQLVVLKNNTPACVMLSPEEYTRMAEIVENYHLLMLAQERMTRLDLGKTVPEAVVLSALGITEADIAAAEDEDIQ